MATATPKKKEAALASRSCFPGLFYERAPHIILAGTSTRVSTLWCFSPACSYPYSFNALSVYETFPFDMPGPDKFSSRNVARPAKSYIPIIPFLGTWAGRGRKACSTPAPSPIFRMWAADAAQEPLTYNLFNFANFDFSGGLAQWGLDGVRGTD